MARIRDVEEIRRALNEVYERITDLSQFKELMHESALYLDLRGPNDRLLLRNEIELFFLYDFTINEYRKGGMTFIEEFQKTYIAENQQEERVLEALLSSRTTLLKVSSFSRKKQTIIFQDLVEPERNLSIMDKTLSQTVNRDSNIFFLRPLSFGEFNVTSGFLLVFPGEWERYLVKKWNYLEKMESPETLSMKRFKRFFKLFGEIGYHKIFFQPSFKMRD